MKHPPQSQLPQIPPRPARRLLLQGAASALACLACSGIPSIARAQSPAFENWVNKFRPKALARGVSEATYARVMQGLKPDTTVYELLNNQDEFQEKLWQYLNRRVSD